MSIKLQQDTKFVHVMPFNNHVACLHCGEGGCGLHLLRVQVTESPDKGTLLIGRGDIIDVEFPNPDNRRGSVISIFYGCEQCGAVTVVSQQFHKGVVMFQAEILNEDTLDYNLWPGEFWRD